MAIALSGEFSNGASAVTSYDVTGVTAALNTVMIAVCHVKAGSSVTIASITDSAGNAWTFQGEGYRSGSNSRAELWTAPVSSSLSGGTVTINNSSTVSGRVSISVWSGTAVPLQVDGFNGQGQAATTSPSSVTVTTTDPGDVIVGGISYPNSSPPTAGPGVGWTTLSEGSPSSTYYGTAAYLLPSSTGTYGPTWTLPSSVASGAVTIALKPSSTATTIPFVWLQL